MVERYLGARILIVCRECGFKLYTYDNKSKAKFNGAPNPLKAISYHGLRCPACDRILVPKPTIRFMAETKYQERYQETEYFVHEKKGW